MAVLGFTLPPDSGEKLSLGERQQAMGEFDGRGFFWKSLKSALINPFISDK